jgi:hypothetical protein
MVKEKEHLFDSMSPYLNLDFVSARSPEELRDLLRKITTPFKIHFITVHGSKLQAWISGDLRIKRTNK